MPATSPSLISDGASLSDKLTRFVRAFVAEEGTTDAVLPGVADEVSPNKSCVTSSCSKDDLFTRPRKQAAHPPVAILVGGVMPFIQGQERSISVFGDPPISNRSSPAL